MIISMNCSLKIFESFRSECADSGFDLDLGIILKNLIAFTTRHSRFKVVGNLSIDKIRESWEPSKHGFQFALDFCESNAGIKSPILLSSPFLLITLAYFGHSHGYELSSDQAKLLRYWLFIANAKGRYSRGLSETILDQDIATVAAGDGADGLIKRVQGASGRLNIQASDLIGRNQRSALFKTMYLAFKDAGAKDWQQGIEISLSHRGKQHRLQFHHIFPKAVLKGHYRQGEINDICNLAFIGGKTNRRISDKQPAKYLAKIIEANGEQCLVDQCMPIDLGLYHVDRYPEFLEARRALVAERLNEFVGTGAV